MKRNVRTRMLLRCMAFLRLALVLLIGLGFGTEQLTYADAPAEKRIARQPKVTDIKRERLRTDVFAGLLGTIVPPPVPPQIEDSQIFTHIAIGMPLPPKIPNKQGRPTTLIIADVLDLEKAYTSDAENVIIMADTVRLKNNATIDLSAGQVVNVRKHKNGKVIEYVEVRGRPKAGTLTIVARQYVTEANGYLLYRNSGNTLQPSLGQAFLIAEERILQSKRPQLQPGGLFLQTLAIQVENASTPTPVFRDLGKLWIDKSINPKVPNGRYTAGYWAAYLLSTIAKDIQLTLSLAPGATPSSITPGQQEKLLQLVKKGKSLYPILFSLNPQEVESLKVIESKRLVDTTMGLLSLWTDELHLPSNTIVQVVYDGENQTVYLAPNVSLVRVIVNDQRRYLGYLDQHPQNPQQALLSFDVKLSVDTDVEQEVKETLSKEAGGFSYNGLFAEYDVKDTDFGSELSEVKSANVTSSGDIIHVSLGLDPESAGLTLARLAASSGVPLHMTWAYRKNANVKGDWQIPVSFGRRDLIDVELRAKEIRNNGKLTVTVEYVLLPDNTLFQLEPPLTLQPGESKITAYTGDADFSKSHIPPDAVIYHVTADPLREIFVRDASIYDTVEITNLLGAHHQLGPLHHVEVTVVYSYDPTEDTAPVKKGPFNLSSKGTMGSQQKVTFVRRQKGDRDIMITGVAFYETGSQQALRPKKFQTLSAAIEQDMVAP